MNAVPEGIGKFVDDSLEATYERLHTLGVDPAQLVDPGDTLEHQVAMLRSAFLKAERSALPFHQDNEGFWRVMKAKLQPIVLAYLTHTKFLQSQHSPLADQANKELIQIYEERLKNSERFRQYFFRLNEQVGDSDSLLFDFEALKLDELSFDADASSSTIQNNVLVQLEQAIRGLEKRERSQLKLLKKQQEQTFVAERQKIKLEDKIKELEKKVADLTDENIQLQVAVDAAKVEGVVLPSSPDTSPDEALQLKIEDLERELSTTSEAAYNAFMANADLGIVILFMLTGFRCNTISRLGDEVVRSVSTYGIQPYFRIMEGGKFHYFHSGNRPGDIEYLYEIYEKKGQKYSEGPHFMVAEEHCSLLVTDMPVADPDKCERLKDNLSTLMQGASASLNLVLFSLSVERQKQQMEKLIIKSDDVFSRLDKNIAKSTTDFKRLIQTMGMELRSSLGVIPGDSASASITNVIKALTNGFKEMISKDRLVDVTFSQTISKVAASINIDKSNKSADT